MITNRNEKEKQVKDTMYLFFEGYSTERKYFNRIENIRSRLFGNSIHLILQPIGRDFSKMKESHPWRVYDYLRFYEEWVKTDGNKCQYDLFLTCFLNAASKQNKELNDKLYPDTENDKDRYDPDTTYFDSLVERLKNILIKENLIFHEKKTDYVYVDKAFETVKKEMETLYPRYTFDIDVDKYLRPIKSIGKSYYGMVVDRDQPSFHTKDLCLIRDKCKRNGYSLIITNPNFELWLALHTKDYKKEEMLEDITNLIKLYAKGKSTKTERDSTGPMNYLKKRYPEYNKNPYSLDIMNEDGLKTAVNNLKQFHETSLEIVSKELTPENVSFVGSNILDIILR